MSDPIETLQAAWAHLRHSPVEISSAANPRHRQVRELFESARERKRSGLTVLEGWHLLDSWLQQGRALQTLVLPQRSWRRVQLGSAAGSAARMQPASAGLGAPSGNTTAVAGERAAGHAAIEALLSARWLILDDALFDALDILPSPAPVLALVETPRPELPAEIEAEDVVILDRVQDPGNVGTIIRTAAAAGIRRLITTPGTAACWSPKVLRAGMGGHFVLELFESVPHEALLARLKLPLVATVLQGGQVLYRANLRPPLAWIFGNEGEGVDPHLLARIGQGLTIPQQPDVESLNVAASAAICLFEQRRQRGL